MKLITKNEAAIMRDKGFQDFVKKSKSKHPKYYIVEDRKALNALEEYKQSRVIKEYR